MEQLKKAGRFLCSMKCAIVLLVILAAACTVGSVIPQGQTLSYYTNTYSETMAGAILLFGLDDIFHCWWFIGLTLFLCANLIFCNILRFPSLIRRMKEGFSITKCLISWDGQPAAITTEDPEKLFGRLGFRRCHKGVAAVQVGDKSAEAQCRYSSRNKIGIWGAWLCHLGMLIIIAGFGFGQMFQVQYTVYGVPGQTKPIGDTGYEVHIDDFEVRLREDATVEQYETSLTVSEKTGESSASYAGGKTSVNSPLTLHGMKFYQNSTGWAATIDVWKDGQLLQQDVLCAGEYTLIEDMHGLAVLFNAFYPDYVQSADGMPMTATAYLNNPGYLYTLYYHDQVLGMNILTGQDAITVEDYMIIFHDPRQYTLLQIKRDPFSWLTALGGILVMAALILAFYLSPEEVWAVKQPDGRWFVAGKSKKTGAYFLEKLANDAGGK